MEECFPLDHIQVSSKGDLKMTDEKKLELLADTFDCATEDLSDDMSLDELENWNSMTKLSLIVLMDDEFGKTLTSDEIKGFKTVGDVMAFMD